MDYSFKITTHGRAVLAACLDLSKPLKLTRAAVGSGLVDQDEDLAKVHALVRYEEEAAVADRRHVEDRLFLTVRYCNKDHPNTGTFTLSEFMVWAEDPETGQETDFLYAALGDYRQAVPALSEQFPESTFSYPLVLVVSGELQVSITASPGLVTWEDLLELKADLIRGVMMNELTLPLSAASGEELLTSSGTPLLAVYHPNQLPAALAAVAALENRMEAGDTTVRAYADNAGRKAAALANAYTVGKVLDLTGEINAAKTEAVSAAETDAAAKVQSATDKIVYRLRWDMYQHNSGLHETHPGFLKQVGDIVLAPPKDFDHEPEV